MIHINYKIKDGWNWLNKVKMTKQRRSQVMTILRYMKKKMYGPLTDNYNFV